MNSLEQQNSLLQELTSLLAKTVILPELGRLIYLYAWYDPEYAYITDDRDEILKIANLIFCRKDLRML